MNEPDLVGKKDEDFNNTTEYIPDAGNTAEVLRKAKIAEFEADYPQPPRDAFPPHELNPSPPEDLPPTPGRYNTTQVTPLGVPENGELADDNPFDDPDEVHNYQFADWLEEDRVNTVACKTLPLTFLTWLTFLFIIYLRANIADSYRMRECLTGAIEEIRAHHTIDGFGQDRVKVVKFHEIASVGEMWSWIEGGLVPAMYSNPAKPAFVRTFNQVIGEITLRQSRVKTGDCLVGDDLAAYFRQECYGAGGISKEEYKSGSVWFAPGIPKMEDKLSKFNQERFLAWLQVRDFQAGQASASALRNLTWIDSGSKTLEILIAFFNAEIQAYAHLQVTFTFERDGFVSQKLDVRPLWTPTSYPWYFWIPDILWWLCVLKFIANSTQKAIDSDKQGFCHRCCKDFWLFLDWLGIVVALGLIVNSFIFMGGFDTLADHVGAIATTGIVEAVDTQNVTTTTTNAAEPEPYSELSAMQAIDTVALTNTYYAKIMETLEDLEYLLAWKSFTRLAMFWYAMIFLIRFFKGFRGQPRIMEITSTLASASADLLHFAIIFLVVFINFGFAGHVLFGSEVTEWSTMEKAFQSSLSLAYGRVDWEPIYRVSPYAAIVWLFGYAVAIVLLLLNMLLAIIADHYGSVYHKIHDKGYGIIGQSRELITDTFWNFKYTMRFLYKVVWDALPARMQNVKCYRFRCFPYVEPELRRPIPYTGIYAGCRQAPMGIVDSAFLQQCGCDQYTADYLLWKCNLEMQKRVPENYSLEKLFDEFDESMKLYYYNMDTFSNELRSWFAERTKETSKMNQRQNKLHGLATIIEEADTAQQRPPPPPEQQAMLESADI